LSNNNEIFYSVILQKKIATKQASSSRQKMPSVSFFFFDKEDAFGFEWKSSGFTPSSHVLSHSGPFSSSTTAHRGKKGKGAMEWK
jgi:hypothetical protein